MTSPRTPLLAALLALLLAAGCGLFGDRSRFYLLSAAGGAPAAPHALRVGLGPVGVPAYLDRPAIATRVRSNRLDFARFDRWAAPLSQQIPGVLAEDLAAAGPLSVVLYPWYPTTPLDAAVRIDLLAFESDDRGAAHLDAAWSLVEPGTGTVRRSDRTVLAEPADGRSRDAAVAALSRALGELARRIADALAAEEGAHTHHRDRR